MNAKIIIIGINNANTLGLIRSIGISGRRPDVLLEPCNLRFCSLRFSKYIGKLHILKTTESALDVLRSEYWDECVKPVILCSSDKSVALLNEHYDELSPRFSFFNAGFSGRVGFFLDKVNTFHLAAKSGIEIINTRTIHGGHPIPIDIACPCIVKGGNSTKSSKSDMCICRSKGCLIAATSKDIDYLVQDYIEKEYELDIVGLSLDHGNRIIMPGAVNKVREFIDRQSLFVRLDDIGKYLDLPLDGIRKLVSAIRYEGIFSVELIFSKGKYYFLEINLRNDWTAYIYTRSGANYPLLWVKYAEGSLCDEDVNAIKLHTPTYMMQEADLYAVFEGRTNFFRWFYDFCRTDVFPVLNVRDLKPFLYIMCIHVVQVLKRPLKKLGFCKGKKV